MIRYRQVRDERSKIIKRRKRESEIKLVRTGSKDPRTVFSYKVSDRNNHDRIGPLRKDGVVAEKNEDMVELFSEQFSSVFSNDYLGSLVSCSMIGSSEVLGNIDIELGIIRVYFRIKCQENY